MVLSCTARGADSTQGSTKPSTPAGTDAQLAEPGAPPAKTEPLAQQPQVLRDLVQEAGRAELDAGGLLIDIGSLDMHKYSRGGWMSGWGRNLLDGETSAARVEERVAWLDVVVAKPVTEIVIRARGRANLGVALDKGPARHTPLSKEYAVHRITLRNALTPGRHRLKLVGRNASVDWVWLSEEAGAEPPDLRRWDAEHTALLAAGDRSYGFYLIPEKHSRLRWRIAGDPNASLQVSASRDGQSAVVLFEGKVGTTSTEEQLDLSSFIGHPTRLQFSSAGGSVHWRDLALVRDTKPSPVVAKGPQNVIVLLIDTQRADSFSVVSGKGIGAAAYESLVKTSSTFESAYNSENWTKPSIASFDTGLYPTAHLARWRKDKCSGDLVFLSEHLQEQGFATAALVSNLSAGPKFGFNQGWHVFEKTDNAQHAFGRALHWLDNRDKDKRFFLYVQTIDPHVPFSVPQGTAEELFGGAYNGPLGPTFQQSEEDALNAGSLKLKDNDKRWLRALYDAEVLYHDKHLGSFLEGLAERGTLDDTAFVILNDHGEEFGEQGRWGHGWTLGDALYRSPLLMHFPGFFPAHTFPQVVEHIDVAPTIVDALGVPALTSAQGQSLLPLLHERSGLGMHSALLFGRPKFRALRVGDFKLVLQGKSKQQLFHMRRDPDQTEDVLDQHPIALRLAELALGEAIANPRKAERLQDRSVPTQIRPEFINK